MRKNLRFFRLRPLPLPKDQFSFICSQLQLLSAFLNKCQSIMSFEPTLLEVTKMTTAEKSERLEANPNGSVLRWLRSREGCGHGEHVSPPPSLSPSYNKKSNMAPSSPGSQQLAGRVVSRQSTTSGSWTWPGPSCGAGLLKQRLRGNRGQWLSQSSFLSFAWL